MKVHDGHRARKKQQFLHRGADSFADHELLELALYYAIPRRDTNELAHRLLETFGSLQGVLNAPVEELQKVDGVGESVAVFLHLMPELLKRAQMTRPGERNLNSPEKCGSYFLRLLGGETREVLYQLCLDGKGKLLLFNCHPEIHADSRDLVAAGITALTGRPFRLPEAGAPSGHERVGFMSNEMNKPALEKFLELKHDPKVFVVPLTATDVLEGRGETMDRMVKLEVK